MLQAPLNNIIVTIDRKWIGNFSNIMRNAQLTHDTKLNPADLVNIIGTVVSAPKAIRGGRDCDGWSAENIKPGDTAIFRYDVIYSFAKQKESEEPVYKNEFWYKGKSYWKVDIHKLFAIIRDNKIIMLNGYCMVENMSKASSIILAQSMRNNIKASTATLTHIGANLSDKATIPAQPLDTVFYDPHIAQVYKINDNEFGIIRQKDIYATCQPNFHSSGN